MSTPTVVRYEPRGAARALFLSHDPECLLPGAAGSGKSRACLEKMHLCCSKYPGMRGLIARKSRASLTQTAMVTLDTHVLHPMDGVRFHGSKQEYQYPNSSVIVVAGLDNPVKIMSTEYDMAYVQEAIEDTEEDWESISMRLRNGMMPYQQIIGDTNPGAPTHWLRQRADRGALTVFESRYEDNPRYHDGTTWTPEGARYIARLDQLTGVRLQRYRYGRWVAAEGVVYESFDRALHLASQSQLRDLGIDASTGDDPLALNRQVIRRVVIGVDWGYTNPGVLAVYAVDGDGRATLVHEVYQADRTIDWWIAQAKALHAAYRADAFVCDPAEPGFIRQFVVAGLPAVAAQNAIRLGIQVVEQRLARAGDGRPRLLFYRDALTQRDQALADRGRPLCTADEFDTYVWAQDASGKPAKEVPHDDSNHALDVLRYVAMYLETPRIAANRAAVSGPRATIPVYVPRRGS